MSKKNPETKSTDTLPEVISFTMAKIDPFTWSVIKITTQGLKVVGTEVLYSDVKLSAINFLRREVLISTDTDKA